MDRVDIDQFDGVAAGHSAQTLLVTIAWPDADQLRRREVVVRVRPEPPGLLEPCEMGRQFEILRALEPTPVRAPAVLWREPSADVLGQEFFVMERLPGTVFERDIPDELVSDPARVRAMSEALVDELAAIHRVDVTTRDFAFLGDGRDFLDREIAYWGGEMRRVQRGPLPAMERLLAELEDRKPDPSPVVTLVHGDPKPGNFAFVGHAITADFDWELTTVGDPLADVAYAEVTWALPGMFTTLPASLTPDDLVTRYEGITGIEVRSRPWHRAFQQYKIAVIMLLGAMLFDSGATNDPRLGHMGYAVAMFTTPALAELGVDEALAQGPVHPRPERTAELDR